MNETIVWLGYVIGAGIAIALVYLQKWPITPATVVGGAVGIAIWAASYLAASSEDRTPWLQVELALNGSLSLIFAAAGAAIGAFLRHRQK